MKAIILAAGYGTRLGDMAKNCAKPLLAVGDKPLIQHLVEKIRPLHLTGIYVVTNDLFYDDFVRWAHRAASDVTIINDGTHSKEGRLGSLGDLQFVVQQVGMQEDLLVLGGDNYFEDSLQDFLTFFQEKGSAIMLHDVKSRTVAQQLGIVSLDAAQRVVHFVEKPSEPPSTLASTLVYALKKEHLPYIAQARLEGITDRMGDFIKYLAEREHVFGYSLKGHWFDIGTLQQLERARKHSLSMNIAVFGTGYVGLVTGTGLANLGHRVICVDIDAVKIKLLQNGEVPFYEPGLKDLVLKSVEKGRLAFTTEKQRVIEWAEIIFNCVGTPSNADGSANLDYVFSVIHDVAAQAQNSKIIINKSTVPPGTAQRCQDIIEEAGVPFSIDVVSNPEFLKEGSAVYDFAHPDKIVIGARQFSAANTVRRMYSGLVRTYIPVIETDWETAEMIKYANNSFLATKISFINEIANICDTVGADVRLVAQAMGLDYRISPKFLNAGVGYGGSCFPKDVKALIQTAHEKKYDAQLLKAVDHRNELQKKIFIEKIQNKFGVDLTGKIFTIWGLSFKPKTSDVREAPALAIIKELLSCGAAIKVYDPVAEKEAEKVLGTSVQYCPSIEESVQNSSAIILVTEWDEFRNIDLEALGRQMNEKIVFDGRNIYEPAQVREEGFEYVGVGRK